MIQLKLLIEQRRFIEALYYGALQCNKKCNAEEHLYLGLACCAVIKPIAQNQRRFNEYLKSSEIVEETTGFIVTGNTKIVYEGLYHLVEAKRKNQSICFHESLFEIVKEVMTDLEDYLKQEFHGFIFNTKHSVRSSGFVAYILLKELIKDKSDLNPEIKRMEKYAQKLLDEILIEEEGDAEFYK